MKITTLLGSAKKKGNTATVLEWVEEAFESMGHEVERIHLHGKTIHGCMGCAKCKENPVEIGCVQKDDAIDIMERMIASDGILYASPLYFWGFSAQIKTLIDRGYALVTKYHQPGHTSLLKDKRIGLLVTAAGGFDENAEGVSAAFDRIGKFLIAGKTGELFVGGCSTPDNIPDEIRDKAVNLARSLTE
jgi:multimeric flavodoxin WrbA